MLRDVHAVRTPENVLFEYELAGLGSRALAWAIDLCVMLGLVALASLVSSLFGLVLAGFARALYFVALFAIQWGYGAVLEWRWDGQTVGKRVLRIRVLGASGVAIGFGQAALRNLLRVLDIMPGAYLLGALCVLFDARARRFGDMAADCVVVRARRSERPAEIVAPSDRYNSFASVPWLAQAARTITAPERDAMLGLAFRRERLPLGVRHELFARLARHLERRLGIERPEYLSDERFVLNVTAALLRRDDAPPQAARRVTP